MDSRVYSAEKCNFLSEPDSALQCVICLEVAEEPWQHGKCGRLLCKECLEKLGRDKPCPNCRMENPQYFVDNRSRRDIKALPIKCSNMERGCEWRGTVGTLEEHVDTCRFSRVPCPRQCKDASNAVQCFMKKDLEKHLKGCPNRPHQCQHCGMEATHAEIQVHDKTCPKKKVYCRNCMKLILQEDMDAHINTECPLIEIPCKFANIGCKVKKMRNAMPAHEGDDSLHLHMALNAIVELKDIVHEKNMTLNDRDSSITFSVSEYKKRKETNEIFISPSFYTGPNGYHMGVLVYANGDGNAKGTHVSVFAPILEGKNDDKLNWPFVGEVTFTLLNQVEDRNHHTMTSILTPEKMQCSTKNPHGPGAWGFSEFIPHSKLSCDTVKSIQYLKDNTLYFRVSVKSKIVSHKPWLQCKINQSTKVISSVTKLEEKNKTLKSNESLTFILSSYQKKKEADEKFHSPSFYTSPDGYHMAVKIYANGEGSGKGTHLSGYSVILEGKHDVELKWPFIGKVKITLLNQLEDKNHYFKTVSITAEDNTLVESTWGYAKFIPHSALPYDPIKNTQYLKDDTLYFRVSVEVADHKHWLQCTIKKI